MSTIFKTAGILAGITILLSSCSHTSEEANVATGTPVNVTLASPRSSNQQGIFVSGKIEATETANISTRVMGYITGISVKVGDRVRKNQLLVSISNEDMIAKKAQAEAQFVLAQSALKNAEKDFQRFTSLHEQKSASDKELENVTLQYNAAKAQVETARQMRNEVMAMLTYTNITAPFDGVIVQKMMDAGSIASPGMPILVCEQTSGYQVYTTVTESEINTIKSGMEAIIRIKSTGKELKGTIAEISQSSQFTGGQYPVKIQLANKDVDGIYAGMYANVFIPVSSEHAEVSATPLIPVASIINRNQLTGVYTLSDNNTALLRWIRLGKIQGDQVEVLSGLGLHEKFIVQAEGKLYNGAPVTEGKEVSGE